MPAMGSWKLGIYYINGALSKLNCYALYVRKVLKNDLSASKAIGLTVTLLTSLRRRREQAGSAHSQREFGSSNNCLKYRVLECWNYEYFNSVVMKFSLHKNQDECRNHNFDFSHSADSQNRVRCFHTEYFIKWMVGSGHFSKLRF